MSRGGSIEVNFEDDESTATNELEEYLLQQKRSTASGAVSSFFSSVGSNVQKVLPRRVSTAIINYHSVSMSFSLSQCQKGIICNTHCHCQMGGTGSIEDDISLRFGRLFGSTSSGLDSSSSSQQVPKSEGWFTLVIG